MFILNRRIDRKKCPKEKEWDRKHHDMIQLWNRRHDLVENDGTMDNDREYARHLRWHRQQHRLKLKPAWTTQDCLDLGDEDGDDEYNALVKQSAGSRRDYAPVYDRVVCISIWFVIFQG